MSDAAIRELNGSAVEAPRDVPAAAPLPPEISEEARQRAAELIERLQRELSGQKLPTATYRLQFHKGFTFHDAAAQAPYLRALGISHVYASPFLKARSGSMHGYDIVDHSLLNPELGGDEGFAVYTARLQEAGLQQILDLVPNHMGVGTDENPWWQDVLENGPSSAFANCFDIEWHPLKQDLDTKVLLPVLGDQFGKVLEDGQLELRFDEGAFRIEYFGRRFPLAPRSYIQLMGHRLAELEQELGAEHAAILEYQSILTAIRHLPPRDETDPEKRIERQREKEVIKRRIARLCDEEPRIREFLLENIQHFNGRPGDPHSFDPLDDLLLGQAYRLSFWRVAADEINYRRFFDVNELAAVCMERPEVFDKAHQLVLKLLDDEKIHGIRIDHADGLFDPTGYLWQLQERRFLQRCRKLYDRDVEQAGGDRAPSNGDTAPSQWDEIERALRESFGQWRANQRHDPLTQTLYLVVEKILEGPEKLPPDWPVHGTTGYEFLNHLNSIFVDHAHSKDFTALYAKFIGQRTDFPALIRDSKKLIMKVSMSSELNSLGHQLDRISERRRSSRDFTLIGLTDAIREVVACFPVYRTYTTEAGVLDRDRRYVEQSVARAKRFNPAMNEAVFDFIRDTLLLTDNESLSDAERRERLTFVGRFQQFTGPMMAKAVEDTSFYIYNRLVSLNEVGGDPEHFGEQVSGFHKLNQERQAIRPYAMLATSTHDTKRSEDVRARINVLSEIPHEWKDRVFQWTKWNKRKKLKLDGDLAPSRNDEYLLYQTLVGSYPFQPPHGDALAEYLQRIQDYTKKAASEAKVHTSWIAPHEGYEKALREFIAALLCEEPASAFRTDFEPFAARIARLGMWNALSQTALKLASPGVPDIYQGTEMWDFSLVDPDNRRPVDYALRQRLLDELDQRSGSAEQSLELAQELLRQAQDGRCKLLLTSRLLRLRRESPELLTQGEYLPLEVSGHRAHHVCAFARRWGDQWVVVTAPRLVASLLGESESPPIGNDVWGDTKLRLPEGLDPGSLRDALTGQSLAGAGGPDVPVATVLQHFPVSVLTSFQARS